MSVTHASENTIHSPSTSSIPNDQSLVPCSTYMNGGASSDQAYDDVRIVHEILSKYLSADHRQYIFDCIHTIHKHLKMHSKQGYGLMGGALADEFVSQYMKKICPLWQSCHDGQADFRLNGMRISFKKTQFGSDLALSWSRNDKVKKLVRPKFEVLMILYVMYSEKWYHRQDDTLFESGWYIIPVSLLNEHVTLSCNNKTDTLIKKQELCTILQKVRSLGFHIPFPTVQERALNFDLTNAFLST